MIKLNKEMVSIMYIEKRVILRDINYYIRVELEYKRDEDGHVFLRMKNYKDDYYDGGDFSILIEEIEKKYTFEKVKKYDDNISYMADIIYLYEKIPFLSGIRDEYISSKDNLPYSIGYISKEEIEKYIEENNIKIYRNDNFKLYDGRTWNM